MNLFLSSDNYLFWISCYDHEKNCSVDNKIEYLNTMKRAFIAITKGAIDTSKVRVNYIKHSYRYGYCRCFSALVAKPNNVDKFIVKVNFTIKEALIGHY